MSMCVLYVLKACILYFAKENIIGHNSEKLVLVKHNASYSSASPPSFKSKWNLVEKWILKKIILGP